MPQIIEEGTIVPYQWPSHAEGAGQIVACPDSHVHLYYPNAFLPEGGGRYRVPQCHDHHARFEKGQTPTHDESRPAASYLGSTGAAEDMPTGEAGNRVVSRRPCAPNQLSQDGIAQDGDRGDHDPDQGKVDRRPEFSRLQQLFRRWPVNPCSCVVDRGRGRGYPGITTAPSGRYPRCVHCGRAVGSRGDSSYGGRAHGRLRHTPPH